MTDFPRQTCGNCDAMTKLVKLQAEEIKTLRAALVQAKGYITEVSHKTMPADYQSPMLKQIREALHK